MPDGITTQNIGGIQGDRLRSFIERIERLHEEREALSNDVRDVFAEAKGTGFDVKIMREVLKIRRMDRSDREERDTLLDLYLRALGME